MKWVSRVACTAVAVIMIGAAAAAELGAHPRSVISHSRLRRLRALSAEGDDRYVSLREDGMESLHENAGRYLAPGYARSTWAEAATGYALLYLMEADRGTKEAFAEEALCYMGALADDLEEVGDGRGGAGALAGEGWVALRNHGVALVTAYDWLYGYENFRADRKTHFALRLCEWIEWYQDDRMQAQWPPWDHRRMTWFSVKALTAIITLEHNPRAQLSYLEDVRTQLENVLLPALSDKLEGGYPPDGWALRSGYDRLIEVLMTFENALGERFDKALFRDVVRALIHSTKPDRKHIYEGGAWPGEFAGYPVPLGLAARLAAYLDGSEASAWARFYLTRFLAYDEMSVLSDTESLIYLDPKAESADFTLTERLSYFSPGAGMIFMRSSWEEGAFWAAFQSGSPHLSEFQNLDQGHIQINYLGEDLLIDAGMLSEELPDGELIRRYSCAVNVHNTIVLYDGRLDTKLAQHPYGEGRTLAYEDGRDYVYARADITGAYQFEPSSRYANIAELVERELFYLRPNTIVLRDIVKPRKAEYPRYLLFNFPRRADPAASGVENHVKVGEAALKIFAMLPKGARIYLFKQTGSRAEESSDYHTWGQRVVDESGGDESEFLTVLNARHSHIERGEATREIVEPYTMSNSMVVLGVQGRFVGIARGDPKGSVSFTTPVFKNLEIYVTGLAPETTYAVEASGRFTTNVRVYPARDGRLSTPGGVLAIKMQLQTQRDR